MHDETTVIETILSKRIQWVEANKLNEFEDGINKLLTEIYPDTAHFIYELLQNAEDAEASKVDFNLKKDMLIVRHNGKRLFNEKDVKSITSIGESTKKDDVNQIGKFGVGFKSVFSYTKTPRIYSGNFRFELRYLVCPYVISPADIGKDTLFEFPFNHADKNAVQAFTETANMLQSLKENVLLFLNNIKEVDWHIEGKGKGFVTRRLHNEKHIEIDYKSVTGERVASHWLRFTKPCNEDDRLHVALAFKLFIASETNSKRSNKKTIEKQIAPIIGKLSIFFPAEKETTELKFHIHGPYASTVARDSIPDNNEGNKKLLEQTAILLAESLYEIKNMGLLTTDFLAVLPNNEDELSVFYKPLQQAVINEMKKNELVPTHSDGHAPAETMYQGPSAIREVISDSDLRFLSNRDSVKFAEGVLKNSRQEKFIRTLGIEEWGHNELVMNMQNKLHLNMWLSQHNDMWMRKFYLLLNQARVENRVINETLSKKCTIIRLQDGEHKTGDGVYFPNLTDKENNNIAGLLRVKAEIFKGDKEQTEKIRQFLVFMGVKEVSEKEEIEDILKMFYEYDGTKEPTKKKHIEHMKRFINWWTQYKEDIFSDYSIFLSEKEYWCKPKTCYIDEPYRETGLKRFYLANDGANKKYELWHGYKEKKINIEEFSVALGVEAGLSIIEQTIPYDHPDKGTLNPSWWGQSSYRINKDYTIRSVHDLLKKPTSEASYLIWRCILEAGSETTCAQFRENSKFPTNSAPSSLVYDLKKTAWIPDKKGAFYKPCDITKDMLHRDFIYDDRNGWLTAIEFGENERKKSEEHKTLREGYKKIGLIDEYVVFIEEIAKLPKDEQNENLKEFKKHLHQSKFKPSFPEKESPDPERRALKVRKRLGEAPNKSYENRKQSVRVSNYEIKPEVRKYLQDYYTNDDRKMICQTCEQEMPFKLDNGSYYFEAVECIKNFQKESGENYIALCPICAAKYRFANGSNEDVLRSEIQNADGLTIPVNLAKENKTIRFVKVHLEDLKVILEAE